MASFSKHSARDLSYSLLGPDYLPIGDAEMSLRDAASPPRHYRFLKSGEIELLTQFGNTSADWGSILVADPFHPHYVQRCRFFGMVRIAGFENLVLEVDGLTLPVGITDSTIVSCDLGRNVAVSRVGYLAHVILADEAVVMNVGSFTTTRRAVFGNGILRGGKDEDRLRVEVSNENGGRAILPFAGMLPADAWLASRHPEDAALKDRLRDLTDAAFDPQPGHYSCVGTRAVIREARTLIDAIIGPAARITGANRVENVTLLSDEHEPSVIAEGAEAIDGIVGYGARIGHGVKARRFVLGTRARVEDGARFFHTFLGDNSTVACCEVLGNLIFPFHEQHHNNSFLIAATIQGQSNIAAGVTLGSNHNSRAPDGEMVAARGFWPGLCANFKHNCRFASWTLLVKGNYANEIDLPLPFSLVKAGNDNAGLLVTPAWWFTHNLYAVERSRLKFRRRDKRIHAGQHIETDPLAPDTIEEILLAIERLEQWTGAAALVREATEKPIGEENLSKEATRARGRELLESNPDAVKDLAIVADGIERSGKPTRLLNAADAWRAYRNMIHHNAVLALIAYFDRRQSANPDLLRPLLTLQRECRWVNMGGQLVGGADYDLLRANIVSKGIASWQSIHAEYDRLWAKYSDARARHAASVLLTLHGVSPEQWAPSHWGDWLRGALEIQRRIAEQVRATRLRDATDPFRRITFASREEMEAVLGRIEDDATIRQVDEETAALGVKIETLLGGAGQGEGASTEPRLMR